MNVRPEFLPALPAPKLLKQVAELAQTLDGAAAKKHEHQQMLDRFNRLTGKTYELTDFWGLSDPEAAHEFAEIALCSVRRFSDVQDSEFLEIISFLLEGRGSERDMYYWFEFLRQHLPHPAPSDLIFQGDRGPEEILHLLKTHQPIVLED